jgi:tyrosine-protein kinase Etk/Wzc
MRSKLKKRINEVIQSLLPASDPTGYIRKIKEKIIELQIGLQSSQEKKKALNEVITQYEERFEQIPRQSIEYAKLQRARLSSEKLYLLLQEKYSEATIAEQSEFGYIEILDPAIVPRSPVSPNIRFKLFLSALVGLALGLGIVFLREYFDVRIYAPEDLKKRGYVPLTAVALMDDEIQLLKEESKISSEEKFSVNGKVIDSHLISFISPFSTISESYRLLRTNIQYAKLDQPVRTILITSPGPADGKSTTASNLAISFAYGNKKVLLIDADMRRPNLHNEFGLQKEPGLTNLLFGKASFDELLQKSILENLNVICCGTIPPNPSEILGSNKMYEFVEQIKQIYDIILFDSPPILAVTDSSVLSTLVDGVIIVISAGNARLDALQRSVELIEGVGGKVLGIVLNNFDLKSMYGKYSSYYRYGYYKYHYRGSDVSTNDRTIGSKIRKHKI